MSLQGLDNFDIPLTARPAAEMFPEAAERAREGRCTTCGRAIEDTAFRDALSAREFRISGMCQVCQDSVWLALGGSEEDEDDEEDDCYD